MQQNIYKKEIHIKKEILLEKLYQNNTTHTYGKYVSIKKISSRGTEIYI